MEERRTMEAAFTTFVDDIEPRLRRAYIGWCGVDAAHDATAEALAWAWEHWERVRWMTNPAGYLYRVGQTRTRERKEGRLPAPADLGLPDVEPDLVPALRALPDQQRAAVWLVHACGFTYAECGDAMGISASAVGTHLRRGLDALRVRLAPADHDIDDDTASNGGSR
jgi:DNA-directed RNA polymerase specialized sigma24 family protein